MLLRALLLLAFTAPVAAPSANIVQDFRLAGEDGSRKAVINLSEITDGDQPHPFARVYWITDEEPPSGFVTYTKFDCTARTYVYEHLWVMDRALENFPEGDLRGQRVPERMSTADQVIDFVCGSREARLQHQYLGAEWKSAIRVAAPHFR